MLILIWLMLALLSMSILSIFSDSVPTVSDSVRQYPTVLRQSDSPTSCPTASRQLSDSVRQRPTVRQPGLNQSSPHIRTYSHIFAHIRTIFAPYSHTDSHIFAPYSHIRIIFAHVRTRVCKQFAQIRTLFTLFTPVRHCEYAEDQLVVSHSCRFRASL